MGTWTSCNVVPFIACQYGPFYLSPVYTTTCGPLVGITSSSSSWARRENDRLHSSCVIRSNLPSRKAKPSHSSSDGTTDPYRRWMGRCDLIDWIRAPKNWKKIPFMSCLSEKSCHVFIVFYTGLQVRGQHLARLLFRPPVVGWVTGRLFRPCLLLKAKQLTGGLSLLSW